MTTAEMKKQFEVILGHLPALRAAGVTHIELGEFALDMAPPAPVVAAPSEHDESIVNVVKDWDDDDSPQQQIDPLNDPDTFGGRVPSLMPPAFTPSDHQ